MPKPATIADIFRYPVKGLSADRLERVTVRPGETLPFDRAWAIENGPSRFDPAAPAHLPKIMFLMLMRNERLAALTTQFDERARRLTFARMATSWRRAVSTTRTGGARSQRSSKTTRPARCAVRQRSSRRPVTPSPTSRRSACR